MYFHKTPALVKWLFPQYCWHRPTGEKIIYLTFDDGPIPIVTEWVLETLAQYAAGATFFCVGDNVRKHPDVFRAVIAQGHTVGNHTFHHLNGWNTPPAAYLANIAQCRQVMREHAADTRLFRPPYGRLSRAQARALLPDYRIVMWEVLTGDFDAKLAPEQCLQNAIRYTRAGSIVTFHDSLKAERNLRHVLPRYLEHFSRLGYRFETLKD